MPPLTIILPTYNGERFLERQIETILAQSRSDFELLVMDDGSTDTTVAILDDYIRRDRRMRRLGASGNRGQRTRLRQLFDAASTELVAIADQDDLWHPERNAFLLDAIGDRAVAFGRSELIGADDRELGNSVLTALGHLPNIGPLQALFQPLVSAHAAVTRRTWLDSAVFGGWLEFDRAMGVEALFSDGLVYVDEAVVYHRIHGSNQLNGLVGKEKPAQNLISRQQARLSLNFLQADRLSFYLTARQLARSAALKPATAATFKKVEDACWNSWYQPHDRISARASQLEQYVHKMLKPYASSIDDQHVFQQKIKSLSRSQYGPTNLKNAAERYLAQVMSSPLR